MSVSSYAKAITEYDAECGTQSQTEFIAERIVWDKFSDTNQGNYNSNFVNFSSLGSAGISPDVLQTWNQAKLEIPVQAKIEILDDVTGVDNIGDPVDAEDIKSIKNVLKFLITNAETTQQNALCIKNNIHLIDRTNVKWSNVEVTQNENMQNFYRYLQMLNWNNDKYEKMGNIINYKLDQGAKIQLTKVGEVNNDNEAHYSRCAIMNVPLDQDVYNSNLKDNLVYNKLGGLIDAQDKSLTFHWFAKDYLALQHDFFNSISSLGAVLNFDIKLQLNCGIASSWIITYKITVESSKIVEFEVDSIDYVKGAGNVCPFMIGEMHTSDKKTGSNKMGIPLNIASTTVLKKPGTTAGTTDNIENGYYFFKVRLSSIIGSKTEKNQPCRIYMPSVKYAPKLLTSKLSGTQKIYYKDYILERLEDENRVIAGKASNKKHTFNNNLSKVSKVYIIPILSNSDANKAKAPLTNMSLLPYESPVSSCPNTFNGGFRFKDVMLLLGNQRIYPEKITEENDFYDHSVMSFFSQTGSNLIQEQYFSTQLTLERWRNGYGVYVFDLVNTTIDANFSTPRSWQLEYSSDCKYDFNLLVYFEQEKNLTVNLATGELVLDA